MVSGVQIFGGVYYSGRTSLVNCGYFFDGPVIRTDWDGGGGLLPFLTANCDLIRRRVARLEVKALVGP